MSDDTQKNEAFDIIFELALKGMSITKSDKVKSIFDEIAALARYKFNVINYKGLKDK